MPAYIKFDGIDGEVVAKGREGWIAVTSYAWGASNSGRPGSGSGAGKASFSDLSLSIRNGKASPKLYEGCASGKAIKNAILEITRRSKDREQVYLKIELRDCLITSYAVEGDQGSPPVDSVSVAMVQVIETVFFQEPDGSFKPISFGWDVKANKKV